MSNRIQPNQHALIQAYQRTAAARPATRPAETPEETPAPQTARPGAAGLSRVPLSAEEQQMIDQHFPPRPTLTLRLYGPGSASRSVNPGALGTRLDVRG